MADRVLLREYTLGRGTALTSDRNAEYEIDKFGTAMMAVFEEAGFFDQVDAAGVSAIATTSFHPTVYSTTVFNHIDNKGQLPWNMPFRGRASKRVFEGNAANRDVRLFNNMRHMQQRRLGYIVDGGPSVMSSADLAGMRAKVDGRSIDQIINEAHTAIVAYRNAAIALDNVITSGGGPDDLEVASTAVTTQDEAAKYALHALESKNSYGKLTTQQAADFVSESETFAGFIRDAHTNIKAAMTTKAKTDQTKFKSLTDADVLVSGHTRVPLETLWAYHAPGTITHHSTQETPANKMNSADDDTPKMNDMSSLHKSVANADRDD